MRTITHSAHLRTLLLGAVMATGIAVAGEPDLAWLGFAMAAAHGQSVACRART